MCLLDLVVVGWLYCIWRFCCLVIRLFGVGCLVWLLASAVVAVCDAMVALCVICL